MAEEDEGAPVVSSVKPQGVLLCVWKSCMERGALAVLPMGHSQS